MLLRRPIVRVGRPGLLGTVARTAVVAGTATAVAGGVARHQRAADVERAEAAAYEQQQAVAAAPPSPAPAGAPAGDPVAELERLGQLKAQGLLTDEEFTAAKSKLLGL